MKVGFSVSYNALFMDYDVYPLRIAGDVLQTYWIIKYLRKNFDIEFVGLSPKNDINHLFFFFLSFFSSELDLSIGFNPNFYNFLYYNIFNSSSLFVRLFSGNSVFRGFFLFFNTLKFMKKNRVFINNFKEKFLKKGRIKYIIVNSETEKREFSNFLTLLNLDVGSVNFYVIYNPIDYEEIDYLMNTGSYLDFRDFKRIYGIPESYALFIGRFDRIKNINNFVVEYKKKKINKEFPLVILGSEQEYDHQYYKVLTEISDDGVILINVNRLNVGYSGKDRYFFLRKLSLEFIRNSFFVVVPSLVESFGFVGLEAMYMNKPLVITKNSPYGEIFHEYVGKSLKLIDPLNLDLSLNLFSFDRCTVMKEYVRNTFGIDKIAYKYLEVWKKHAGN
ncbi:MAG: glycosyltransferase [Candidatus Calescibacterium sp.]|nr:glycosyltransferase [Candidatus Calescibacterium sp.]